MSRTKTNSICPTKYKIMKKMFAAIALVSLLAFAPKEDTYTVDKKASNVHWLGKKAVGQHDGDVLLQSGTLKVANGAPLSGEFVLDMNSITVTDIKEAEKNKNLVDHLKNEDFFGAEKFPTATIIVKKFEKTDGNNYNATADLTIKGIKNEITFPAKVDIAANSVNATANITIDRTKWNISYQSKSILGNVADRFIYDDVEFTVKLVLKK